jgi:hypothetical protein
MLDLLGQIIENDRKQSAVCSNFAELGMSREGGVSDVSWRAAIINISRCAGHYPYFGMKASLSRRRFPVDGSPQRHHAY